MIKMGGPVFPVLENNPEAYAMSALEMGYSAVNAPGWLSVDRQDEIRQTRRVLERAGLLVAEAGCWENLLDTRPHQRARAWEEMLRTYQMAEELGARCVVTTAGSFSEGPGYAAMSPRNFTKDHFDAAVETARYFIDAVRPRRTFFTYEVFLLNSIDSPESYGRLVKAVDRPMFGAHVDLVNFIRSPRELFMGRSLARRCVRLLGDRIISAHVKDLRLVLPTFTTMLQEVPPGEGCVDIESFVGEMGRLSATVPLMMEHLSGKPEYLRAIGALRAMARRQGVDCE